MSILSILITLLIIGFLVTIHEFGHFIAARSVGIRVDKFAIGFGPRIFKFMWKETEFSLRLILLGGYVQMKGDADPSSTTYNEKLLNDPESYLSKHPLQKIWVSIAGVSVNFIFGVIAFMVYLALVSNTVALPKIGTDFGFVGAEVIPVVTSLDGRFQGVDLDDAVSGTVLSIDGTQIQSKEQLVRILENNYNEKVTVELFDGVSKVTTEELVLNGDGLRTSLDLDYLPASSDSVRLLAGDLKDDATLKDAEAVGVSSDFVDGHVDDAITPTIEDLFGDTDIYGIPVIYTVSEGSCIGNELADCLTNETQITDFDELTELLDSHLGGQVEITFLDSNGYLYTYDLTLPEEREEDGSLLGVRLAADEAVNDGAQLLVYPDPVTGGLSHSVNLLGFNFHALSYLIGEAFSGRPDELVTNVSSVAGIQQQASILLDLSSEFGPQILLGFLNLVAFLSIILAFMNILPVPVLDGGNIVFILLEWVRGKPLPPRMMHIIQMVFVSLLVLLMVATVGLDIYKAVLL